MIGYPYSSPIILNDTVFVNYGGQVGSFTAGQLAAAYITAEMQATSHIGTLLKPTIVTGTFGYMGTNVIGTDYGYVHRILGVTILSKDNLTTCSMDETASCAYIWNDTFGYIDITCMLTQCGCPASVVYPYQYRIAYEAGLPTGTSTMPSMLLALTMAAQITLNEIAYPSANESTGDIGVTEFSSQQYSEKRKELKRTAFGNSAKANKVAQLIDSTVMKARPMLYFR